MENPPRTDTLPTQASLVARLHNLSDARSWSEFYRRYEERVTRIARGRGLTDLEAREVAHEVFKRVAQTIGEFELMDRPGSFRRWLFQLTRWKATDHLRDRLRHQSRFHEKDSLRRNDLDERTSTIERIPAQCDNAAMCAAEARQHIWDTLLKQVERSVSPKQLQIFQLLALDETETAKVAELYGMSVSAVYVTKHRVAAKLREEMTRLELPLE